MAKIIEFSRPVRDLKSYYRTKQWTDVKVLPSDWSSALSSGFAELRQFAPMPQFFDGHFS